MLLIRPSLVKQKTSGSVVLRRAEDTKGSIKDLSNFYFVNEIQNSLITQIRCLGTFKQAHCLSFLVCWPVTWVNLREGHKPLHFQCLHEASTPMLSFHGQLDIRIPPAHPAYSDHNYTSRVLSLIPSTRLAQKNSDKNGASCFCGFLTIFFRDANKTLMTNGNSVCKKWTQRSEFKSWSRLLLVGQTELFNLGTAICFRGRKL